MEFVEINIQTKEELYKSYLSFIEKGGIFILSDKAVEMHQKVKVKLVINFITKSYDFIGEVVWINTRKNKGFAVSFPANEIFADLKSRIENILSTMNTENQSTYTM